MYSHYESINSIQKIKSLLTSGKAYLTSILSNTLPAALQRLRSRTPCPRFCLCQGRERCAMYVHRSSTSLDGDGKHSGQIDLDLVRGCTRAGPSCSRRRSTRAPTLLPTREVVSLAAWRTHAWSSPGYTILVGERRRRDRGGNPLFFFLILGSTYVYFFVGLRNRTCGYGKSGRPQV